MINARTKGIASKPTFRQWRARVLADGFYEWQKLERGRKQPVLIRRRDHSGRPA